MEQNAQEVRKEREAEELRAATAKAAQETAEELAEAQADAAAKAQAEAAAAERAAEALRNRPPQLVVPLRAVVPEIPVPPPEEAGGDQLAWRGRRATSSSQRGRRHRHRRLGRTKAAGLARRPCNRLEASRLRGQTLWSGRHRASA